MTEYNEVEIIEVGQKEKKSVDLKNNDPIVGIGELANGQKIVIRKLK